MVVVSRPAQQPDQFGIEQWRFIEECPQDLEVDTAALPQPHDHSDSGTPPERHLRAHAHGNPAAKFYGNPVTEQLA
ncbi:MAG: hypothetical protein R6W66_09600 [Pelovirga sp.]